MFEQADEQSDVLVKLQFGDVVELLSEEDGWAHVVSEEHTGYVRLKDITILKEGQAAPTPTPVPEVTPEPEPTTTPEPEPTDEPADSGSLGGYDVLYKARVLQDVTLIADTGDDTSYVADVPAGDTVRVVDANASWSYVLYGSFEGFVRTDLLQKI